MFRFVHTADVHLDSPLRSLALRNEGAAETVANATRQSFVATVDLCIQEDVDALLIAGDLYDGELRSMKTAAFFCDEMQRLVSKGIRVFILRGNHDAESRITKELRLPEGVHLFPARGKGNTVILEDKGVALHGVSFSDPHVSESLLPRYPAPKDGLYNIGLLHTSLAGSTEHDVYAPCSLQELADQGYDYWALGHIHKRMVEKIGDCTIVMPGIPQGRHINESGAKSVTLANVSSEGVLELEERTTGVVQFERLPIDLTGTEAWEDAITRCETALRDKMKEVGAPHVVMRVECSGITQTAGKLYRDIDILEEELNLIGNRAGSVFIEKIVLRCHADRMETKSAAVDPMTELYRLMHAPGDAKETIEGNLRALLQDMQKKLPPDLRDDFDDNDGDLLSAYLNDGAELISAYLSATKQEAL